MKKKRIKNWSWRHYVHPFNDESLWWASHPRHGPPFPGTRGFLFSCWVHYPPPHFVGIYDSVTDNRYILCFSSNKICRTRKRCYTTNCWSSHLFSERIVTVTLPSICKNHHTIYTKIVDNRLMNISGKFEACISITFWETLFLAHIGCSQI